EQDGVTIEERARRQPGGGGDARHRDQAPHQQPQVAILEAVPGAARALAHERPRGRRPGGRIARLGRPGWAVVVAIARRLQPPGRDIEREAQCGTFRPGNRLLNRMRAAATEAFWPRGGSLRDGSPRPYVQNPETSTAQNTARWARA